MTVGEAVKQVSKIDSLIDTLCDENKKAMRDEGRYGRMQYTSLDAETICEIIGYLQTYRDELCTKQIEE